LIDVAGAAGLRALPPHHAITVEQLEQALAIQKTDLRPGMVVLVRTGAIQFWDSRDPEERTKLTEHDSAGITLEAARWLVEQKGAMLIGSDTSGLEYWPENEAAAAHQQKYGSFMPVHNYLLIEQGVHIGELHHLEELARERIYEFTYICTTNKIRGTVAGFALRPIAIF
jgi:kynurenine formamidase